VRPTHEHRRSTQPRVGLPAGVWSLAALSVAACLCSVLGAKLLSNMFEPPGALAPEGRAEAAARNLGRSAPQVEAPAPTLQPGVDRLPTGTIPNRLKNGKPLTPCGDPAEIADH